MEKGFDQKAVIEYIKVTSGVKKVAYIGHLHGSTIMFHALTKDIEESYFAENMSAFIALAPVLTETPFNYEYEEFIKQDWNLKEDYSSLMGIIFRAKSELFESFCEVASKNMCEYLRLMRK